MMWLMQKKLGKRVLYNADKHAVLYIRTRRGKYYVFDSEKKELFRVEEPEQHKMRVFGLENISDVALNISKESSFTRPPRVEFAVMKYGDFLIKLKQEKNRKMLIYEEHSLIGQIHNLLRREAQIIIPNSFNALEAALFYILGDRMISEDDVDII